MQPATKRNSADRPSQSAQNRLILRIVVFYALIFTLFGLVMASPGQIVTGLVQILTTRDALITDYIGVGGLGAAFVNAGLLTLIACLIYQLTQSPISGAAVASLFLMLGFGLFGKNLLNVWPVIAGVVLYARFKRESFGTYIHVAFFGCALAPVFSEILYSSVLPLRVSLPLALVTALLMGFVLPPVAAQCFKAHEGFNLYNLGFTAGILGLLVVALYKSYGFVPDPVMIWTSENRTILATFLALVFGSMILGGFCLDRQAFKQLPVVIRLSGQAPTDFIAAVGAGPTFVNMGLCGLIGLVYVLLTGAAVNGPTIGGILTIAGFAAFGKHPVNIVPILLGIVVGSLGKPWNINDPAIALAALFGTTLAPIAGQFGWQWGIVAGVLHSSAVQTVGYTHGGLNLYNNGFAAGIVAMALVPVIGALKSFKTRL